MAGAAIDEIRLRFRQCGFACDLALRSLLRVADEGGRKFPIATRSWRLRCARPRRAGIHETAADRPTRTCPTVARFYEADMIASQSRIRAKALLIRAKVSAHGVNKVLALFIIS
jgi:hypothetical protein